ncbi:MAG: class I lanthipeptide [Salibacteraceae bacterium]
MSLNLNKQKIVSLSRNEMNAIKGGGLRVSNRKEGNCPYSRRHPNSEANGCVEKVKEK